MKLVITSALSPELVKAVLDEAASLWPSIKLPLHGFLTRSNSGDIPRQDFLANHAHFADDQLAQELGDGMEETIASDLSKTFTSITFAYIAMECFGGYCEHKGSVWRADELMHREFYCDQANHRKLLEYVGINLEGDFFAPFMRGYFE